MKTLLLTASAEHRLEEIASYTLSKFGSKQAGRYEQQLVNRLTLLCSDNPPHGRPCNVLRDVELADHRLFFYREGMHYIIYEFTETRVIVHDLVHVSRNLPELLAAIENEVIK